MQLKSILTLALVSVALAVPNQVVWDHRCKPLRPSCTFLTSIFLVLQGGDTNAIAERASGPSPSGGCGVCHPNSRKTYFTRTEADSFYKQPGSTNPHCKRAPGPSPSGGCGVCSPDPHNISFTRFWIWRIKWVARIYEPSLQEGIRTFPQRRLWCMFIPPPMSLLLLEPELI